MYFLFDVPLVPPVKTHQFYNMMQPLFSSTPAIKVEDKCLGINFSLFKKKNTKNYLLMDEKHARLKMFGII